MARNEAVLETVQADCRRASAKSAAASGESEAIAAQGVAGGRPQRPHGEFGRVMVYAHADPAGVLGGVSDSVRKILAQS